LDGDWEAPLIDNPEWKGVWSPPRIPNPAYKGEYVQPLIPNPDYVPDDSIYVYDNEWVGLEIWQVKSGTLFDHILITDDISEAENFATGYFAEQQKGEKAVHEKQEEEKRKEEEEERKKREAEMEKEKAEHGEEDVHFEEEENKEHHDEL